MYPEHIVNPMKADLTSVGFENLDTAEAVEKSLAEGGTMMMVVNSVCGCAAGACRPGVKLAIQNAKKPSKLTTVFAGFDVDAIAKAREHFAPYPPSSPAIALFKEGKLVHFIERHHIEGKTAQMIADHLKLTFEEFC